MTREQRLVLFQLLPPQAQYVEVLSRNDDTVLLAWRARQWGTTAGMVRVQATGPLAGLGKGDKGTRIDYPAQLPDVKIEEVTP